MGNKALTKLISIEREKIRKRTLKTFHLDIPPKIILTLEICFKDEGALKSHQLKLKIWNNEKNKVKNKQIDLKLKAAKPF